jgi:hypothetical protein
MNLWILAGFVVLVLGYVGVGMAAWVIARQGVNTLLIVERVKK